MTADIHTIYSISSLADQVRMLSHQYDVVSFDVFDTLLVRRTHDPDLLKMATARFISNCAASKGISVEPEKVQRLRDKVEAMHRRRAGLSHPDHEACYPDFMADVLRSILGEQANEALLDEVTDYELSVESSFLVAREEFLALTRGLKEKGKRLVAVTDMYLPADHVRRLLDTAGFSDLIDEVFSSADSMKAKASGAAWPLIQDKLGLDASRWLHIGDNPVSDGVKPSECGITAMVLRDVGEQHRLLLSKEYYKTVDGRPFWRGRLAQQWMLPLEGENKEQSDLYVMGYHYFGPMLCAFIHHLAERTMKEGVRRVYFMAREGEILRSIWKTIAPALFPGRELPEDQYLYVSRMATASPACAYNGLSYENARIAMLPATNRDFRDICRVFSLDVEPLRPFLAKHGLREDTPLSRWHDGWKKDHDTRLRRMLDTDKGFQEEVKRQTKPSCNALERYLESEKFFEPGPVALVDIGWLGTIQRFLYQSVQHRDDHPRFYGFLLANTGGYPFPYEDDNQLDGYFYDHRRHDFAGSVMLYARELFEEITRASHAGLMAYKPKAPDGFELAFRSENDEQETNEAVQTEYFAPIKQGILDAARRYAPVMAVLGFSAQDWKPWLNAQTVKRFAFPSTSDVQLLTRMHHLDDFGSGQRNVPKRAHKVMARLWNRPIWMLRFLPGIRTWYYLKHAVHFLRL